MRRPRDHTVYQDGMCVFTRNRSQVQLIFYYIVNLNFGIDIDREAMLGKEAAVRTASADSVSLADKLPI